MQQKKWQNADMNQNTCEPAVIYLPLSSLENMQMELSWRIDAMLGVAKEGQDLVKQIKRRLNISYQPNSPLAFDPLQTIGKYC